ncbi:hypothetical protein TNCV_546211 [Trichonephila clavipes]|nr:hypothetical protein TNCV_546211 [Trichonephila clavipes]
MGMQKSNYIPLVPYKEKPEFLPMLLAASLTTRTQHVATRKAGRHAVLLSGGSFRVPLEIVGSSGHESTHARKTQIWSDQEDHEERIVRQALVDPTVTRSSDTSRRRRSNCSTNNFQTLACQKHILNQRPFHTLALTPEHRQL